MANRSKQIRVAIVATHPIQYQAPLWRRLAGDTRHIIHVIYGSDLSIRGYRDSEFGVQVRWDTPLTAGYSHEFLERDESLQQLTFSRPSGRGVGAAFDRFRPDVVVLNAYNGFIWLRALWAARLRGIPIVMRHEASDEAQARTAARQVLRDLVLGVLYCQVSRFAAIGTNARRHLLRLGVAPAAIGCAPYCVDSDELEKQFALWHPQRAALRDEFGVREGGFVFIFSGKLIAKKQPLRMLEAIALLSTSERERLHLIVMGDGEQRTKVEQVGRALLGSRLHLTGFVNQSQVGRWYAAADCLVLPSRRGAGETWGLVVNEALQFGLRVIVSDGVGCAPDLVDEATGAVFPANDTDAFTAALARELGTRGAPAVSRARAATWSLTAAARGLAQTVLAAADARGGAMV